MYIKELEKFAVEPYFYIGEDDWNYVKETYEKDDVKETLAEILMKYDPPYMEIQKQEAEKDFYTLLNFTYKNFNEYTEVKKNINTSFFETFEMTDEQEENYQKSSTKVKKQRQDSLFTETPWFARSEYDWKLSDRVLKRNNAGNKASNFFQQKNRWSVDGSVSPGPLRTWTNKDFMTSLMGSLYSLKAEKVDKSALRTSIGLRKYICSQFKPNVAKLIYDFYVDSLPAKFRESANKVETVLDFSMGWGDRLCGFYASNAKKYIGIDPRTENHPIYNEQKAFYEDKLKKQKETVFIESPAEDADLTNYENSVDLIFTSPPYFSVERYSYDDTQSWVRHKNIDRWNKEFLHKALNNVLTTLKSGGLLMVNISDVNASSQGTKGGKQWLKICDPMNEYLQSRGDMKYVECFGMEMAKRPNCLGIGTADDIEDSNMDAEYHEREGSFGEPVWVWQKN
tara:strand:- start:2450 stop:3808 length:1359 start_codon:yes stop_codon:yes gene_type:complete